MATKKQTETIEQLQAMTWKEYIKSLHWQRFRNTLDTDSAVCEICGKPKWNFYKIGKNKGKRKKKSNCQFHVHHKRYSLGCEKREDVMILCSTCHTLAHDLEMASRTRKGVFYLMYEIFKYFTKWEYTSFKERNI